MIEDVFPKGLDPEEVRHGAGVFGTVVTLLDHRLGGGEPVRRIARILPPELVLATWRQPLKDRLRRVSAMMIPHLSLPTEVWEGESATIVIISPLHHELLVARIGIDRGLGLTPQETDDLIVQLLTALAGLHAHAISHGDIRSQNIYVDSQPNGIDKYWLADAAIGPLTWFSQGALRDPDARLYYPPEWKGETREPSVTADLYAMGLTLSELLAGREANPHRLGAESIGEPAWPKIKKCLWAARISPAACELVRHLTRDDADQRPADAAAALRLFARLQRKRDLRVWALRIASAAAIAALLLLCAIIYYRRSGVAELKAELREKEHSEADLATKLQTEIQKNGDQRLALENIQNSFSELNKALDSKFKLQSEEFASHRGDVIRFIASKSSKSPESVPIPSLPATRTSEQLAMENKELAAKEWTKQVSAKTLNLEECKAVLAGIISSKTKEIEPAVKNELRKLLNRMNEIDPLAVPWSKADPEFKNRLQRFLQEPWNPSALADLEIRLKALNRARDKWKEFAFDDARSWDSLRLDIVVESPNDETQKVLKEWYGATKLLAGKPRALKPKKGDAADGYGTWRLITVDAPKRAQSEPHFWDKPTGHAYKKGAEEFPIQWTAGSPIIVYLESEATLWRGGARPNLITHKFSGPLALWRANYEGKIESGDFVFEFDIEDCPGPPTSVFPRALLDKVTAPKAPAPTSSSR